MDTNGAVKKRISCLCLSLLLAVSLAACDRPANERVSTPPTASVQPADEPTPTTEPTPAPPAIPFTDVPENSFYYDAVVWAYENGVASGGPLFEPLSTCTRGQVITFIWRAMGSPEPQITESPVGDISPSDWFYQPVLWAYESGISTSSAFDPNSPCTNGEALTFLWRAEGKPMAAVNSSAAALAAAGAYYERPAAWADSNGLFAQMGAAFDPAAPCSRAHLMSYLYWAEEQWTSAAEAWALQAEYERIINSVQPARVYGSGLIYADYVDVDGNGTVELLTVGVDWDAFAATATVYADVNGHAEKLCEQALGLAGAFNDISIYQADNRLYIGSCMLHRYVGAEYIFYTVENGAFVCSDNVREEYDMNLDITQYIGLNEEQISEAEYLATCRKYTEREEIFDVGPAAFEFHARGIVPDPRVEVNGTEARLSAAPYYAIYEGETMVPLRDVLEAMGVAVYANGDASVILASTKSDTLTITYKDFANSYYESIDSTHYGRDKTYKYSMNGGEFQKCAIEFTDGKTFVPLQTIVSLFGATAEWDGEAGAVQITSNIPDSDRMSQDELKKIAGFNVEQANRVAISKGYKGGEAWGGTLARGGMSNEYGDYVYGGLTFKNGKAVWTLYAVEREEGNNWGFYAELYRVDVASDGTVTAYPNEKAWDGAGQF